MVQRTHAPLPPALARPPRVEASKPQRRAMLLATAALALAGAAVGYGLGKLTHGRVRALLPAEGWGVPEWGLLALGLALALWLVLAVHEIGHLLGARRVGWAPVLWCVGPLRLDFGAGRVQARFNRAWGTWGGLAAAVPPSGGATPAAMAWVVAGGPLASLALAGAAGGLAMGATGAAALAAGSVAAFSAVIALATLIPTHLGGFRSDGAQLLALWRRDPGALERLALSTVWTQSMAGVRPRDWDAHALATASAAQADPSVALLGALMQAQAAWDRRDLSAAGTAFTVYAERLHKPGRLAQVAAPFRGALLLPVAVYLAQGCREPQAARAWLEASQGAMVEPHAVAHAQAALAWAEGRDIEALREAERAGRLGLKSTDPGAWAATRDDLDALRRALAGA